MHRTKKRIVTAALQRVRLARAEAAKQAAQRVAERKQPVRRRPYDLRSKQEILASALAHVASDRKRYHPIDPRVIAAEAQFRLARW